MRHSSATLASSRPATLLREIVSVHDLTDCLIEAYDCVARLAYEKFVARGAHAGGELDDWLTAEHELLDNLPADIQDSGESITALVSVPGMRASQIKIGIESRWLVIVSRRECESASGRERNDRGNERDGGAAGDAENRADNRDADDDGSEAACDADARDTEDPARDEIEAEKVAEFSRAVHGDRRRERNGAGSIASSGELHGKRRILDVNTFVGRALTGEAIHGERMRDDTLRRRRASGESSNGDVPGGEGHSGEAASRDTLSGGTSAGGTPAGNKSADSTSRGDRSGGRPSSPPPQLFAILELPAEVDAARAVAILADGLLGLRMPKKLALSE